MFWKFASFKRQFLRGAVSGGFKHKLNALLASGNDLAYDMATAMAMAMRGRGRSRHSIHHVRAKVLCERAQKSNVRVACVLCSCDTLKFVLEPSAHISQYHKVGKVIDYLWQWNKTIRSDKQLQRQFSGETPKITFFQCPKVAPLFTPYMGMYPMLLYFIQNLRVPIFTT